MPRKPARKTRCRQFALKKIELLRRAFGADRLADTVVPVPLPNVKIVRTNGKHCKPEDEKRVFHCFPNAKWQAQKCAGFDAEAVSSGSFSAQTGRANGQRG